MEDLFALKNEFLKTWPLERVQEMELKEYTNLNREDSFCYWLESKTEKLGSVWGSSSFKFGIYEKRQRDKVYDKRGLRSDSTYAWYGKFGDNAQDVFLKVRGLICEIIQYAKEDNIEAIGHVDFGNMIKWKIAFLYSDYKILNIFSQTALMKIASQLGINLSPKVTFGRLQSAVLDKRSEEEDFYAFSGKLWSRFVTDNPDRQYWLFVPGEEGVDWENCQQNKTMGIGWMKLPPLTQFQDKKELLSALEEAYQPNAKPTQSAALIWDFVNNVKEGDFVFAKTGRKTLLGYGIVTSDYFEDESMPLFGQLRGVDWIKKGKWFVTDRLFPIKTLTKISYSENLLTIMNEESVGVDVKEPSIALNLLDFKKQIILQGAPGTGKTRLAVELAMKKLGLESEHALKDHPRFKLVQFHPSYSYEDFVRGIVASPASDGNGLKYEVQNKVFADFAEAARASNENYVIVIDEINRANLSAVLGELIYSLEYRGKALDGIYDYSSKEQEKKNVLVPENLMIIGTMNTADRSVGIIDYAIRRRFAFVDLLPRNLAEELKEAFDVDLFTQVSQLFVKEFDVTKDYNQLDGSSLVRSDYLSEEFEPKDVWLGHSYFIDRSPERKDMQMRLDYEIKPILREYVRDGILKTSAKELIDNLKVDDGY